MLLLLSLLTTGDAFGALMLAGVWLLLLRGWLALANWWGLGRGWQTVLAGLAVLETGFRLTLCGDGGAALAAYTLRGWFLPVQILTVVCILALLLRSRVPERALPLRGKWLGYFLAAAGAGGLVTVGPCGEALWYCAYEVGLFGNAYGLAGVMGCILPSRVEVAAGWITLLVGLPYMVLINGALLHGGAAVDPRRPWMQTWSSLRLAALGIAGYGKALIRNENLWRTDANENTCP